MFRRNYSYPRRYTGLSLAFLIVALYILNMAFNFIPLSEKLVFLNKVFLAVAGVLLVIGALKFLMRPRTY